MLQDIPRNIIRIIQRQFYSKIEAETVCWSAKTRVLADASRPVSIE